MKKKLSLNVEKLEERIAPSFAFDPTSTPGMNASPVGGQGDYSSSFGPDSSVFPAGGNLAAWTAHNGPSPLINGGNN